MRNPNAQITLAFYPTYVKWNVGIAQLSSLLKIRGVDTDLVVLGHDQIAEDGPAIVGFSCVCEDDWDKCQPYIIRAKELGKITMIGGVWAGLGRPVPDYVDYVCRGDGVGLAEWLLGEESPIGGGNDLFNSKLVFGNIGELPIIDYDLFSDVEFKRYLPFMYDRKVLPYFSSIGCPHQCMFCQVRYQPKYRFKCKVEEELTPIIDKHHPNLIYMTDALPPYTNDRWKESWGGLRFPFVSYIRADIEPEDLEWLIDRGMVACSFGVESGEERFRNEVLGKNLTDEQILKTIGILDKHKIVYMVSFMVGVPGETFLAKTRTAQMVMGIGGIPLVWEYKKL